MRATCPRYHEENGKIRMELTLRHLEQLFDTRDPSSFRERDLDEHAVEYIVASAQEIPRHAPVKLLILLAEDAPTPEHKSQITDAVHTYFGYEADLLKLQKKKTLEKGRRFLFLGFGLLLVLLSLAEFASSRIPNAHVGAVLREGLAITGWVAMWRPLEVILYDWQPVDAQRKLYEKLSAMEVDVRGLGPAGSSGT